MRSALPVLAAVSVVVLTGAGAAGAGVASAGAARAGVASAGTARPTPSLAVAAPVDPSTAVLFPVEDVVGRVESLVFAEASVDGAVTDRGGREFTLAADVLFAFNKATLTSRADREIARIADRLKSAASASEPTAEPSAGATEPATRITTVTVNGYTDNVGSTSYNLGLSRRRAQAVRARLVTELGSSVTVRAVGLGEADPVADNTTKSGRQANRRVEIRTR